MELDYKELANIVLGRVKQYLDNDGDAAFLATVTSSTRDTVRRWSTERTPPNGERLIKLWRVLAASGIDSPELERLGWFNRYCGELLTYGLVDMNELLEICGLRNPQSVLRALRGGAVQNPGYSDVELSELYGDRLQQTKQQTTAVKPRATKHVRPAPSPPRERQTKPTISDTTVLAAAALSSALVFARYFDSDDCSPEERSKLRALMGEGGMFELSNHFNALCSERSRNERKQVR